jgi:hypothetical protein
MVVNHRLGTGYKLGMVNSLNTIARTECWGPYYTKPPNRVKPRIIA